MKSLVHRRDGSVGYCVNDNLKDCGAAAELIHSDTDCDDYSSLSRDSAPSYHSEPMFYHKDKSGGDILTANSARFQREEQTKSILHSKAPVMHHIYMLQSDHSGMTEPHRCSAGIAMSDYHHNIDLHIETMMRRSLHSPFSSSNSMLGTSVGSMSFDRPSPNAMHQVSSEQQMQMQSSRSISMSPTMKIHGSLNTFESHSMSPQYHHHNMIPSACTASMVSNALVYQVQFKLSIRYCTSNQPTPHNVGDFVTVDMNPGFNVGIVTEIYAMSDFLHRKLDAIRAMPFVEPEDCLLHSIVNTASHFERQQLPEKFKKEEDIKSYVEKLTYIVHKLPMIIEDVECQFDKSKMTIYYRADYRIDFRELVKNIFAMYKVRIWMKRIAKENVMRLNGNAAMALASGMVIKST